VPKRREAESRPDALSEQTQARLEGKGEGTKAKKLWRSAKKNNKGKSWGSEGAR
jgi:hypothetical protein